MKREIFSIGIILLNLVLTASCNKNYPLPGIDFTGEVDTLIDIEGNSYKTIGIGSQIWMAENLRTTKLNDGTIIPNLSDDSIWVKLQTVGLCWYNNDSVKFQKFYGPLYNFYAVNTSQLCPIGWHVPDKSEWEKLALFVGGENVAGGKLKESDGSHWNDPNKCILSNYNFMALPGGNREHFKGKFIDSGSLGYWWSSFSESFFISDCFSMSCYDTHLNRFEINKREGLNVRCIKDNQ